MSESNDSGGDKKMVEKRYDFVLLFDVQDGNPNGDPDAGNLPRVDPETQCGLVTDVCLKRKIRNYVALTRADKPGYEIYVKERAVLNALHEAAYKELKVPISQPGKVALEKELAPFLSGEGVELPQEFSVEEGDDEKIYLVYSGLLDKDGLKAAKEEFGALANQAGALKASLLKAYETAVKAAKSAKPKPEQVTNFRDLMCGRYFDVRAFGAVMATGVNKGASGAQVRGPVQLTFARSVHPIITQEHAITRVAVATEEEAKKQGGSNRTMGRKHTVPYGLYRAHGFISPGLRTTGLTQEDVDLLFEALERMFETDRSAARGMMATRALVVFEHETMLGDAPAHVLFDNVRIKVPEGPPRAFSDFEIEVDGVGRIMGGRHVLKVGRSKENGAIVISR